MQRELKSWILPAATVMALASGCVTRTVYVVDDRDRADRGTPQSAPAPAVVVQSGGGGVAYEDDAGITDESDFYEPLSPYGNWIAYPGYGRVWQPSVTVVGAGFRPYTHGHWEHTEWGWTWVDHHPFGWATGHYGRWLYDSNYGWVWTPGTQWSPAWVTWRTGGGYVGWAAMPPGSIYGGSYSVYDTSWVFVSNGHMGVGYVGGVIVTGSAYRSCYMSTYDSRGTYVVYGRSYYRGPDYEEVRRSGRVIHRPLADVDRDRPVSRPPAGTVIARGRDRDRDPTRGDGRNGGSRDGDSGGTSRPRDDDNGSSRNDGRDGRDDGDSRGRDDRNADDNRGGGRDDGNGGRGRDRDDNGNSRDDGHDGRVALPAQDNRRVDVGGARGDDGIGNDRDNGNGNGNDGGRDGNGSNGGRDGNGSGRPGSDVGTNIGNGKDRAAPAPGTGYRDDDGAPVSGGARDGDGDGGLRGDVRDDLRGNDRDAVVTYPRPVTPPGRVDDNDQPRSGGRYLPDEGKPKKTYVDDPNRFRDNTRVTPPGRVAPPTRGAPRPGVDRAPPSRPDEVSAEPAPTTTKKKADAKKTTPTPRKRSR